MANTQYKYHNNTEILRDFDKLVALSEAEVQQIQDGWKEVTKHNEEVYKQNYTARQRVTEEAATYLEKLGVTVRKNNGQYLAWFKNNVQDDINAQYPIFVPRTPEARFGRYMVEIKGVTFEFNNKNYNAVTLRNKLLEAYELQKEQQVREQELFTVSLKYAISHQLSIENVSAEEIIRVANEHAKAQLLKELLEDDDSEIYFDECSECVENVYYPGEHRCSCGNRRVHLYIAGDLATGLEPVAEAY